jgi:processive 1,2-diacylglycerol beta-glucosyltransferase
MLVHYVVPGQEEGNIRLLEIEGGGRLVRTADDLARAWAWLADDDFAGWVRARDSLAASAIPDPARRTARLILDSLPPP